jgi:ribonuclease I
VERVRILIGRHSFTIHGYWPDLVSNTSYGAFNLTALQPLFSELYKYMPPRFMAYTNPANPSFSQQYFLWKHEWDTHGHDMADIYFTLNPKEFPATPRLRDSLLQFYYFDDTLKLFTALGASNLTTNPKTNVQLAKAIGLPLNNLITRCNPSGTLYEVQICTKFQKSGYRFVYTFIPCTSGRSTCPGNAINLPGFR